MVSTNSFSHNIGNETIIEAFLIGGFPWGTRSQKPAVQRCKTVVLRGLNIKAKNFFCHVILMTLLHTRM